MKNPAQEGIDAAREENARRAKVEREWTGRGSAADAITFADSALIQAREIQKQLGEVIGYLEEGSLLAAVGTAIAAVLIVALLAWSLSEPMDPVYRHDADCDCPACVKRGVPL